jgi:hypothetical protein
MLSYETKTPDFPFRQVNIRLDPSPPYRVIATVVNKQRPSARSEVGQMRNGKE